LTPASGGLQVTWREPRVAQRARPPLLILFHGRGADERDLLPLADALPGRFLVAAPRGPIPLDIGSTWFENRGLGRPVGASLRATVDRLWAWLDGVDPARFDPARIVLLGFSAGMLVASALALDRPDRVHAAILLSGTLPWENGEIEPAPGRLTGMSVFHAHGTSDDVIPPELVARSEDYLERESGADLADHTYVMGHEIVGEELGDIARWVDGEV
jgi:phospholipase/carboxylesterase